MGTKRKRPASRVVSNKRTQSIAATDAELLAGHVDHPVLKHYFSKVTTLREHLTADLRERKHNPTAISHMTNEEGTSVAQVLDHIIVGYRATEAKGALRERRAKDVVSFTQQLPSSTIGSNHEVNQDAQLEVVDFVIWLLFRRAQAPYKPQHLLAQGFDRLSAKGERGLNLSAVPGIPGIVCKFSNQHTELLVSSPWCSLLALLGKGGDIVMIDLLLESCLFMPSGDNTQSLRQISGTPLSSLQPLPLQPVDVNVLQQQHKPGSDLKTSALPRLPSAIKFVRNRMFFAQPATSANHNIRFGLHSIHVLNRYDNVNNEKETVHVLKHIFPRQFRLHNVFTSVVDSRESALPFKDYTLRESEIKRLLLTPEGEIDASREKRVPKRLCGDILVLVAKLRKLHRRCSYPHLLSHYCELPSETGLFLKENKMPSAITDLATSPSHVSAFCQAVINRLIPKIIWGDGETGRYNKYLTLKNVDTFLRARKFESFSLQSFMDGLKISAMSWLSLPHQKEHKMAQSDFAKRKELLAEFVYWLFDSFLIPLVRSNFHVTESNVHRNRLFYFRHDVWQKLCEPALEEFKTTMFEELNSKEAKQRLATRTFGYSNVRLLPKINTFRPITNLRRRPYIWVNGKKMLGRSINSALNPAFRALNHEKANHLDELGCSLFSVSDIYPRLKEYRTRLQSSDQLSSPLYFAKVDVQACFDTIPQQAVLKVVRDLLNTAEYLVENEARVKVPEAVTLRKGEQGLRSVVKFTSNARPTNFMAAGETKDDPKQESLGNGVLVGPLGQQTYRQQQIEKMITEHVEFNLIKIGKKYYRQKTGIPQGSVLSSLLCNFFYGKLEKEELHFLQNHKGTCLLRLIDDFLLITTERDLAERFLEIMHQGLPEYGVSVKSAKSLVNFECSINGSLVPRAEGTGFPYCGLMLDMSSLELSKHGQIKADTTVSDSLTVEHSNVPGRTFRRKALNALKIQMHSMFFDTSFNSLDTALANLYRLFHDAAQRAESYIRSMPKHCAPSFETIKGTIEDLTQLAFTMLTRRHRRRKCGDQDSRSEYACAIRKEQFVWIAAQPFKRVFERQTIKQRALLDWLRRTVTTIRVVERDVLLRVVASTGK